jgi:hypothetical protein
LAAKFETNIPAEVVYRIKKVTLSGIEGTAAKLPSTALLVADDKEAGEAECDGDTCEEEADDAGDDEDDWEGVCDEEIEEDNVDEVDEDDEDEE